MGFLKFVGGVVGVFFGFVLAMKLLGVLFALLGIVIGLVKLAVMVGVLALICYGVYKLFVPAERSA